MSRWRVIGAFVGVLLAGAAFAQPAGTLVLRAEAGVGGIAKANRWTPVRVTLDHTGSSLDGEIHVEWGDARLQRAVTLASPGRRVLEMHVRTGEAEGAVRVRFVSGGTELHAVDAPVRVLRPEEPVALCVASGPELFDTAGCTAVVSAAALPASPRGYEVVDTVSWPSGVARLAQAQQEALDVWAALRALDATGDLGLTPQPARPAGRQGLPAGTLAPVGAVLAAYAIALAALGFVTVRGRYAAWQTLAAGAAIAAGGSLVAGGIGHAGPGGALHLKHASLLQQVPGTDTSLLTVRGLVAYPALDTYRIELPVGDGSIEATAPAGRAVQLESESGPVLAGRFGLGDRQAFVAEASAGLRLIATQVNGNTLQATNQSGRPLSGCRFADGYSITEVGALEPGQSVRADQVEETLGPIFTCVMHGPLPVRMTGTQRDLQQSGDTLIVVYREPGAAAHGVDW